MGYHTDFRGAFQLNKPLDSDTLAFLIKFNETRRMKRRLGPEHGIEGEFFVGGKGYMGQDNDPSIIDYNRPPSTQPGLWCNWRPNDRGTAIEWDGAEKFYDYVEWIKYIIKNFLAPKKYILNGKVEWRGEEWDDMGVITIKNNRVSIKRK